MGGLKTAIQFLPIIKDSVSLVSGALGAESSYKAQEQAQRQALKQLQQSQALQHQQDQAQAALERENIAERARIDESNRLAALRRAVARQKALYGSSGISSAGGSAQAVLLGLFDETQEELDGRERLDSLRNRAIDMSLDNQNSINVLQRTQLQERQKIGRLSSDVGRYTDRVNAGIGAIDYAIKTGSRVFF